jgi:hypothetical protein
VADAANLAWVLLAAYGSALAVGLLLGRRWALGLIAGVATLVPFAPLLIPADRVGLRAIAAFVMGDLFFRLIDVLRQRYQKGVDAVSYRDCALFLVPFPVLLVVYADSLKARGRARPGWRDAMRIVTGAALAMGAFLLVLQAAQSATLHECFLLDHLVKALLFVVFVEGAAQCLCGVERLAGYATTPVVHFMFLARTPADFWRRYNNRVHDWLYHNVFVPSGGFRVPVRAVVLTMLASALFHEVMFDIATSTIDGYQFVFFAVQTPAILASGQLRRLARNGGVAGKVAAHSVTIVWMVATSVCFFHGVARIFPFVYASELRLP